MFNLITYVLKTGRATQKNLFPSLDQVNNGIPNIVSENDCKGEDCKLCVDECPTDAIEVSEDSEVHVSLDLGACIGCGLCIDVCPTGMFAKSLSSKTAKSERQELIISNGKTNNSKTLTESPKALKSRVFERSIAIRVVSTGCTACDLEVNAAFNPIFDIERFGVQIVASPRMADVLVVTGPVGKGMQEALLRTYEAMPNPRLVVAAGTCAISGGIHKGGYTDSKGVDSVLPVDVYIPGCPPHPWSIIHGILTTMQHPVLLENEFIK